MSLNPYGASQGDYDPLTGPDLQAICRPLLVNMQSRAAGEPGLVIGVTSVARRDGRTTVAQALAGAALHQLSAGGRVLLVDADIARPGPPRLTELADGPGLYEVMMGEMKLSQVLRQVTPQCRLLPAGKWPGNPIRSLRKLEDMQFLASLGKFFEVVVLDLPPLQTAELGPLPAGLAPNWLLVARAGSTRLPELQEAIHLLPPDRLAGVVLNQYRQWTPRWLRRLGA